MMRNKYEQTGLTGNQLKILAMIFMTCDHVGMQLLPQMVFLRIIGRLAMPIYAFMIAEGCRHTRSRKKYLLRLVSMAGLCQVVYLVAMGSAYQCILVTFSLSVVLICLAEQAEKGKKLPLYAAMAAVFFICVVLPDLWKGTDFAVDYGLAGVLLPVFIYFGGTKGLLAGMAIVALGNNGGIQWFSLGAVPLLMLYNGQRGRANLGKLFYWYYPVHLAVIYGLSLIL